MKIELNRKLWLGIRNAMTWTILDSFFFSKIKKLKREHVITLYAGMNIRRHYRLSIFHPR